MNPLKYLLDPELIRELLPNASRGTYVLWSPSGPVCVDRTSDLRLRLLDHADRWPHLFVTFDEIPDGVENERLEQLRFAQLTAHLTEGSHPLIVGFSTHECPFCLQSTKAKLPSSAWSAA